MIVVQDPAPTQNNNFHSKSIDQALVPKQVTQNFYYEMIKGAGTVQNSGKDLLKKGESSTNKERHIA
jgi:hypothetical protein